MKGLRYMLSMALLPLLLASASARNICWAVVDPVPQVSFKTTEPVGFKQASANSKNANGYNPCNQYKRREIAGFVLFPVGVGLGVGGGYMIYRGVVNISNNVNAINTGETQGAYVPKHDIVLVGVGAGLAIIGAALVPAGLSMGISGAVRYRKHCTGGNACAFYVEPANDGAGVALRF